MFAHRLGVSHQFVSIQRHPAMIASRDLRAKRRLAPAALPRQSDAVMRILVIQNEPLGPAGIVGEVAAARGAALDTVTPFDGAAIPAGHEPYDGLVVLGGIMGANDTDAHPYLNDVLPLIRAFGAAGKPVMGICLGAQMIARAYGKPVTTMDRTEIGFVPLTLTDAAVSDPLLAGLEASHSIMEWHDDTFELPDGAVPLMTGETIPNQVYRIGDSVYGFQCHLEVRADIVNGWIAAASETTLAAYPDFFGRAGDHISTHIDAASAFAETVSHRWIDLAEARRSIAAE